uniref:F-box family protein n=2 Tax=Solanum tuberosum TaxID=4113 RepID=M1DTG3_SOLTU
MMSFPKQEEIEVVVMEEGTSPVRIWEDLNIDMLVKIFQSFDLFQLISVIPQVCHAWQSACSDQHLWKTLDLSIMKSNFIRVSIPPYIYVDTPSREKLNRILKICLILSHGNKLTLIFHYNLYVDNNQLTYSAKRYSPNKL